MSVVRFTKADRATFPYWFAHWCAYNMTALNLGVWKWKYLLHDIEKPWLLLWYKYIRKKPDPYKYVQQYHRSHNNHHLEYEGRKDYEAALIDWECSQFTKQASPLSALQELDKAYREGRLQFSTYNEMRYVAEKLGLDEL